jgi:hypothetical protein
VQVAGITTEALSPHSTESEEERPEVPFAASERDGRLSCIQSKRRGHLQECV